MQEVESGEAGERPARAPVALLLLLLLVGGEGVPAEGGSRFPPSRLRLPSGSALGPDARGGRCVPGVSGPARVPGRESPCFGTGAGAPVTNRRAGAGSCGAAVVRSQGEAAAAAGPAAGPGGLGGAGLRSGLSPGAGGRLFVSVTLSEIGQACFAPEVGLITGTSHEAALRKRWCWEIVISFVTWIERRSSKYSTPDRRIKSFVKKPVDLGGLCEFGLKPVTSR